MSRTEQAISAGSFCSAPLSKGVSSKRNGRRPNGYISVTSTSGAVSANSFSTASRPPRLPGRVDDFAALIEQGGETGIRRPRRSQAHHFDAALLQRRFHLRHRTPPVASTTFAPRSCNAPAIAAARCKCPMPSRC
jgi:hypothetical protein